MPTANFVSQLISLRPYKLAYSQVHSSRELWKLGTPGKALILKGILALTPSGECD